MNRSRIHDMIHAQPAEVGGHWTPPPCPTCLQPLDFYSGSIHVTSPDGQRVLQQGVSLERCACGVRRMVVQSAVLHQKHVSYDRRMEVHCICGARFTTYRDNPKDLCHPCRKLQGAVRQRAAKRTGEQAA